ncbi:MAG: DUF948 domain-containing protein [Nitrospirae bacterium]|nr:MAG: DUF948 domain-containing protein [Nitrospirota bacterium]
MIIEIAAGIVAVAAVVFVAFLVPVLIQFRKTAEESAHLLRRMNEDLPVLFREAAQAAQNVNQVAAEMREGVARARVLGEAMGEIGETINQMNGFARSWTGRVLVNVSSLLAGFRAAYGVLKEKSSSSHHQEGGGSNGG